MFLQRDATDCGPACLAFVARHYGIHATVAELRATCGTDRNGSTALGVVEAAGRIGLVAKGVRGGRDCLDRIPKPAIAHCRVEGAREHFVVLTGVNSKTVSVMDPIVGRIRTWKWDAFVNQWSGILVLVAPGAENSSSNIRARKNTWERFGILLWPHRRRLLQALIGAVLATILSLASSLYVGQIVDRVIPDGNAAMLRILGVSMVLVLIIRLGLTAAQSLLMMRVSQVLDAGLMAGYSRHLLALPQRFHDGMRVGEMASRVADALKIRAFISEALIGFLLNSLILISSLGVMFYFSPRFGWISSVVLVIYGLLFLATAGFQRRFERGIMERSADYESEMVESLSAAGMLKSYRLEWLSSLRTEDRLVRLMEYGWKAALFGMGSGVAGSFVTQLYGVVILWVGTFLVLDANMTPGRLMICYALAGYITGPAAGILAFAQSTQSAAVAADRLFEIMDLEPETDSGTLDLIPSRCTSVALVAAHFKHPGRRAIFESLYASFESGTISVITGESGSGKSSLLAVLLRIYPLESGQVLVGGTDIRHFALNSLRRMIRLVPQQPQILSGTILENIAPSEQSPDVDFVERLCHQLGLHDFIRALPDGYNTLLHEHGSNLSGGQKQRLAIARALYSKPRVILLDEPTAALDSASCQRMFDLLRSLRSDGCILIIATHDPELVQIADQVLKLDASAAGS